MTHEEMIGGLWFGGLVLSFMAMYWFGFWNGRKVRRERSPDLRLVAGAFTASLPKCQDCHRTLVGAVELKLELDTSSFEVSLKRFMDLSAQLKAKVARMQKVIDTRQYLWAAMAESSLNREDATLAAARYTVPPVVTDSPDPQTDTAYGKDNWRDSAARTKQLAAVASQQVDSEKEGQ